MNPYELIPKSFPNIDPSFTITSAQDRAYNCIAWAADQFDTWWWPDGQNYWPVPLPSMPTVEAFIAAFETLGYTALEGQEFAASDQGVAIYVGGNGLVTHMARKLPDGTWTSKLGRGWDIQHKSPQCLNGSQYGAVALLLGRPSARID